MWYHTLNEALRSQFGGKVYKLALDGGMGCPNRDGTCGTRGCIFCSEQGSGDFAAPHCADLAAQLSRAKARVARKAPDARYIAYFQSFTNTYAPTAYLEALFSAAMAPPEIVALSVATRPDCLPPETVALLARLNRRKPVWVELGLQTVFDETARHIRRGYALPVFEDAVARLKAAGLTVIVHQILGLPGETTAQMRQTTAYIAHAGVDGIKLQLLGAMEERQVTVDGLTRPLPVPVIVLATQNPVGSAGTQSLPNSQLDRFLIRLHMGYPDIKSQIAIMQDRHHANPLDSVEPVTDIEKLKSLIQAAEQVHMADEVYTYTAELVEATRHQELVRLGVSPRGALAMCRAAKATAFLEGRDYVTPDDVAAVFPDVCAHRLMLDAKARLHEISAEQILGEILDQTARPDTPHFSAR